MFSSKAPKQVTPGTKTVKGQDINDKGMLSIFLAESVSGFGLQPGKAHAGLTLPAPRAASDFIAYQLRCAATRRARHKALEGWSAFSGSSPLVAHRWLTLPKKAARLILFLAAKRKRDAAMKDGIRSLQRPDIKQGPILKKGMALLQCSPCAATASSRPLSGALAQIYRQWPYQYLFPSRA